MVRTSLETLPGNNTAIKQKMDNDYNNNISLWSIFWKEGNIATRLYSGDSSLMAQSNQTVLSSQSNSYYFNRVLPVNNMISGYQMRNRKSSVIIPSSNGDNSTADQWTKIILNIFSKENVYDLISEAFLAGPIISGMSLIEAYIDYTDDPLNGDVKYKHYAYNEFMIDPYFRDSAKLSDASFIRTRTYMTHSAAAAVMPPVHYDSIMALAGNSTGMARDGKFQYEPEAFGYTQGNKISFDRYFYRDYRKAKKIYDKMTGLCVDVSYFDTLDIDTMLAENPLLDMIEMTIPTVRLAIQIQDKIFYDGPNPLGIDDYPFVPFIGYYVKQMPYMYQRIFGVNKGLLDPQILFNRRVILTADYCESVVNSGWIFKENAPLDVRHLFQTGQGRIIPIKRDAQITDVQQIQPPQIPPTFFTLQETFDKEIYNCAGISEENMGKIVQDDSSGYLAALRQGAGLTSLQPIFDRLDSSQCRLTDLTMDIIQKNYTIGKIKALLEGEEPAPLFYNKAFGKYRSTAELGFNTITQKQMAFAQKLELRKAGIQIPDESMIEDAAFQNKDKMLEQMKQASQQAQQSQQMQMQVQMQELQARSELSKARAAADMGLYAQRTSGVETNRALAIQKLHEANKYDEAATLDKIKALKELESMDLEHLARLIEMVQALKGDEKSEVAAEENTLRPQEMSSNVGL
jgi:hypothetical protein